MQRIWYWFLCWFCFKTPAGYVGYERVLSRPEGTEPEWIMSEFEGLPRKLSVVGGNIDPHHCKASKQEACAALHRQFPWWGPIIEFPIRYGRVTTVFVGIRMSHERIELELERLGI